MTNHLTTKSLLAICSLGACLWAAPARSAPTSIVYTGLLTTASGGVYSGGATPGLASVTVALYAHPTESNETWGPKTFGAVPVVNGVLSIEIPGDAVAGGSNTTLSDFLAERPGAWIEFTINGALLTPRQSVVSVPYALHAGDSERLGGLDPGDFVHVADIGALTGPTGPTGPSGMNGTTGPTGPQGPSGAPGAPGADAPSLWSANGSTIHSGTASRVGVLRSTPEATLDVNGEVRIGSTGAACTTTNEGSQRYNSTAKTMEFCNGTSWTAFGAAAPPSSLFAFSSHTFTNCGNTGASGPSLSTCRSAYSTAWDDDPAFFSMATTGIQQFTVPATATYRITAVGGRGSDTGGGNGHSVRGDFQLTQGQVLSIVVGQQATGSSWGSGGGGSFVWLGSSKPSLPLIVGGGGGGGRAECNSNNCNQSAATSSGSNGGAGCGSTGFAGGTGGNGGGGIVDYSGGGAGWLSNGQGNNGGNATTFAGAAGGGFGGGGGSQGCGNYCGGGGGGGYNGGGGGGCGSGNSVGGGGSSYVNPSASNATNLGNTGSAHGSVLVEKI